MKVKKLGFVEYIKNLPALLTLYVVLSCLGGWAINCLVYGLTGVGFDRGYNISFGSILLYYILVLLWSPK